MCGRYAIYAEDNFGTRYQLAQQPHFVSQDNYNVAPRQRVPVIIVQAGKRIAEPMQWGFLPPYAKDPSKSVRPINTVAETVFEKPMWRQAVLHHRCLVPARGFYEWEVMPTGRKAPYYIYPVAIPLFSFAGIYSIWKDVEGQPFKTFSIITTAANEQVAPIHNRMPVILLPEQENIWLDPSVQDEALLKELLVPYAGKLEIYRVSDLVNSPRHNGADLIAPDTSKLE